MLLVYMAYDVFGKGDPQSLRVRGVPGNGVYILYTYSEVIY
jgi:hypothetical protein